MKKIFLVGLLTALGWAGSLPNAEEPLEVYFTNPLAGLPLMDKPAAQANGVDRALIELIDSARKTIDAAIYRLTDSQMIAALARACARGLQIRIVTEADSERGNPDIYRFLRSLPCVQLKTDSTACNRSGSLMHHKFAIFDGTVVWTGSLNWSEYDLTFDANDVVVIQDAEVARLFQEQFQEMFVLGRFSRAKYEGRFFTRVSTHRLGEAEIEVYFTPNGLPERLVLEKIRAAKKSIKIAMFAFTNDLIFKALWDARQRGVHVDAVWDFRQWERFEDSEIDEMLHLGVGIVDALPGLIHHKFAVVDERVVITGSANWSAAGLWTNDENLLIIESPRLAALYLEQFERLKADAQRYEREASTPPRVTVRHHNTQDVLTRVEWRPHLRAQVESYELCRAQVSRGPCELLIENIPANHRYYVDDRATPGETYYYRMRARSGSSVTDWSNEYVIRAQAPFCPAAGACSECDCDDGLNNDDDRNTDCDDLDCKASTKCLGPEWRRNPIEKIVPGVISAGEAEARLKELMDKVVTVRFKVVSTGESAKAIFLNSTLNRWQTDFTVVIFKPDDRVFEALGINPVSGYHGKTIEVTGTLREYNGPEIIVRAPWQIEIVGE